MGALRAEKRPQGLHVLPVYDGAEELESITRAEIKRHRDCGLGCMPILLVDMGLGEECRQICEKLAADSGAYFIHAGADLGVVVRELANTRANSVEYKKDY
jgi:hypothetical protein